MRKKVDERIRTLIENGVKARHRSMFVIIGDSSRDQIANLHYMLSKSVVKSRPSVLWCYKDKLQRNSHEKKCAKQIKKLKQRGRKWGRKLDTEKFDPLSLFFGTEKITYCLYKDSERILGNTFGMCILQDFEALTPNLLARTIETVEGGGLIVMLIPSLSSLTSLCTMVMDVHESFCTESHPQTTARFNERFLLSLASCKACIVMDDELNILPISSHMKSITQIPVQEDSEGLSEAQRELKDLKEKLKDDFPVGPLIRKTCTMDQEKAVVTFLDSILDKSLRSTVALLAGRGRGKSAALGLAIAGAVAAGYSNIFVTALSPENVKTLFEFICKGFGLLGFREHHDFDVVKSNNPDHKKAIVRINIYKNHGQTIQFIHPHEQEKLSQVNLLVIDEAAAIPLPMVKSMLGPFLVFLSSTVNGYEGTGRSLSLKLLQQLEEQNQKSSKGTQTAVSGQLFKKIVLSESIRYASGDPIESWLNGLLCLDVANYIPTFSRLPPPNECNLYYVNRGTLFSYHKDSELFLQRMMALYTSSHYKNTPNDLQLMADAPSHHLFVLLGPADESQNILPNILCVIQISFEGQISRISALKSLSNCRQPHGDQIPWKICEQFRDSDFPSYSGARIVRIATHPSAMRLGYGSAAIEILTRYFEGQPTQIYEFLDEDTPENSQDRVIDAAEKASLLEENIKPRTDLLPLLVPLCQRRPERLHYLGVSFGLTLDLFRFWSNHDFVPFYISQVANGVTGEHSCMLLRPLKNDNDVESNGSDKLRFFSPYYQVFRKKFTTYLARSFSKMEYKLAMSVLNPKIHFSVEDTASSSSSRNLILISESLASYAMEHLEAYTKNLLEHHMAEDFAYELAHSYFWEKIPVSLSYVEAAVLLCIGLQGKDISTTLEEIKFDNKQQIMALYLNVMKKFYKYLRRLSSKEIPTSSRLKDVSDLIKHREGECEQNKSRSKVEASNDPELFQQYAISDEEDDFESALKTSGGKVLSGGVISVKSNKSKAEKESSEKKRGQRDHSSKSNKKRKS